MENAGMVEEIQGEVRGKEGEKKGSEEERKSGKNICEISVIALTWTDVFI